MTCGRASITLFAFALFIACGMAMVAVGVSSVSLQPKTDPNAAKAMLLDELRTNYKLPLPSDTAVVQYENRSGRDEEVWALLRVTPDTIHGVREAMVTRSKSAGWTLDDSDAQTPHSILGIGEPRWWTPSALPDADALVIRRGGGLFVVFSVKTGSVYVLVWDV